MDRGFKRKPFDGQTLIRLSYQIDVGFYRSAQGEIAQFQNKLISHKKASRCHIPKRNMNIVNRDYNLSGTVLKLNKPMSASQMKSLYGTLELHFQKGTVHSERKADDKKTIMLL